jgi:hypothetical protein
MHPPSSSVGAVRYGIGADRLAVRFGDEAPRFSRAELDLWVSRAGAQGSGAHDGQRARVVVERAHGDYGIRVLDGDGTGGPALQVGVGPALEVTVPLSVVGARPGDEVRLRVVLDEEGRGRESVPASGALTLTVPSSE